MKNCEYEGLSLEEVDLSRKKYGVNKIEAKKKKTMFLKIISIFKEPMFLLLIIAASVYFLVGEFSDGIVMLVFVLVICLIEFLQEVKTDKALDELNKLASLNVKVIRNKEKVVVSSDEVVVGDIVILEEGDKIPADGIVLYAQGLGVNESALTGESAVVYKSVCDDNINHYKLNMCYSGTDVINGMGIIKVENVGKNTEFGLIGESLKDIVRDKTPLEKQINKLVLVCSVICGIVFLLTVIINFIHHPEMELSKRIVESLLSGITIAMATIPEEIPVILTVFLAMGAWQLTKDKTLTRNMKAIETLGAINVLCTDKTGTITENKMIVESVYSNSDTFFESAYYSCCVVAYDSMEVAIKNYCKDKFSFDDNLKVTKEYAFTSETKMMGQVFDDKTLYVKGAYESVLPMCNLDKKKYDELIDIINNYSSDGFRVLAIAKKDCLKSVPKELKNIKLSFEGLVALYDPPRKGIEESLKKCYSAGIRVIMITGDNGETAKGIAKKINLKNYNEVITGLEIENMSDEKLEKKVKTVNIFARVYPNHKMRIVKSLQKNGEVVAMTGDGVNDAPALKRANIGIAMGKRGTNVAKESADIILLDDNFNTIVKAIEKGRGIYINIRKAISYILVIHIPIALLSLFVPLFNLPVFLLPIHVMLLELLIDPTSSIIFQRTSIDKNIMNEKPRNVFEPILNIDNVLECIVQGLLIFIVVFFTYIYLVYNVSNVNIAVSVAYSVLLLSILLVTYQLQNDRCTLINFINSFKDKVSIIVSISIVIGLLFLIYLPFFNQVANTIGLSIKWWIVVVILVFLSVLPFDILKIKKK